MSSIHAPLETVDLVNCMFSQKDWVMDL